MIARWLFVITAYAAGPWGSLCACAEEPVDYLSQIKPILRERCFACHAALKQEAGLRLDTVQGMIQGGSSGISVIEQGDPSRSMLLKRVTATDVDDRMPPQVEGDPLTVEQVELLRRWITQGASVPDAETPEADPRDHWAFRKVVRPAIPAVRPAVRPADGVRNPIDAFLEHRYEQLGLTPQVEVPRADLLRRLSFDLIGLPPTIEEVLAFEHDASEDWYEQAVQRLLDDPRHGERWARHWMDIWRYSDWWGLGDQLRNSQLHIWHWRDWMIESINADTPYDEMIRQMLAADEIYPNDLDRLRATGFLARNYFLFNRNQWMEETVEHVSKGFLGLTINCSKCHDHKYDPISQVDFYRLRAFFEPYHVRLDVVPGEADLTRDGIPTVYDGVPDVPTYRLIRGQESQPDKSTVIQPGVPKLLEFKELSISPISLPAAAWQPERRSWVGEAHRNAAQQRVKTAETTVAQAVEKLAAARKLEDKLLAARDASQDPDRPRGPAGLEKNVDPAQVIDAFATLDAKRWQLFGGEWSHLPGQLAQKRDGASRAAVRLRDDVPQDFDVSLRFTISGGSQWRSVGISFDSTHTDPTQVAQADESEQIVYVSAVAGGNKVQAAYTQAGNSHFPVEGMQARPIALDREYTLRVQVRGPLINASLDGEPAIAWRTPVARRRGAFQLITYDALAVFHSVTIGPLKADHPLREPGAMPATLETARATVADATAERHLAEVGLRLAQAELDSVECRIDALRASDSSAATAATTDPSSRERELLERAIVAERKLAVTKSQHTLANVELRLLRAAADKKEPIEKELQTAQEGLQDAEKQLLAAVAPADSLTPLVGAKWTPTRFLSSTVDDPVVAFGSHSTGRRTALAKWITDPENPLTARVAVNHLWTRHFGTPLVATVFDFGRKGSPPTHPQLLDWLAAELVDSGWSMKQIHRRIVTSTAYRLSSSSAGREANVAIDPDNLQLWRRSPLRLESQAVRDAILSLAGNLDPKQGGPPVPSTSQADSTRRSIYFFHSNNDRNQFLTTFDEAGVKECYRREQSIVPQQALALTNSRLVHDAAEQIAARLSRPLAAGQPPSDDSTFIGDAFRLLLGITVSDAERNASLEALAAWRKLPDGSVSQARSYLIWALMNHNDFVTIR